MRRFECVLILLFGLFVAGCGGGSDEPSTPTTPTTPPPTGPATLVIQDLTVGEGAEATGTRTLVTHYTLWLYDPAGTDNKGTRIQSSRDAGTPYSFRMGTNAVIAGFEQGVTGMRVGGTRRVVIPPSLAYGSTGSGPIPGNSWIVFELELLAAVD